MQKKVLILYTNYGTGHYIAAKGIEEYLINSQKEHEQIEKQTNIINKTKQR